MRVLFIYPDVGTMLAPEFQHGLGSLAAMLLREGHEARLLYIREELSREKLIESARACDPGLIAFSSVSDQFPRAARWARWLKESLNTPVLIGGIHATLAAEDVMRFPWFDFLCRGEGEEALVELVEALEHDRDPCSILNLWARRGDTIKKNPPRPLLENLDRLPYANRELFPFKEILEAQEGRCSMLSGRGCPYGCSYCANRGLQELYQGKGRFVRRRSVENVLAEMRSLLNRYPIRGWEFHDDIFTLNREWLAEFCARYPEEFSLPFTVNVRVENADREKLEMLAEAGCDQVKIGVESGSERVRREVMGRPMSTESIIKTFEEARSVGLKTWAFSMVGLPGERESDAEETLRLNELLAPDHMQVSIFHPYPGTRLYKVCRERGLLGKSEADGYFVPQPVLDLPEFPRERVKEIYARLVRLRDRIAAQQNFSRWLQGRVVVYDFLEELPRAEIETPEPIFVGEDFFWLGREARRVLRVHPPSRVTFQVRLPKSPLLKFAIALHPEVFDKPGGDGVVFTVSAGRSLKKMKPVFTETIDPKRRPEDRKWHDFQVSLEEWAGKKTFIRFETKTVDPTRPDYNTAGFAFPVLLEGK